jgi:hypothetical protein
LKRLELLHQPFFHREIFFHREPSTRIINIISPPPRVSKEA